MPPAHHEPGRRGRGSLITLGNIIEAIRASALRNRYVAQCGFRGTSLEIKTPFATNRYVITTDRHVGRDGECRGAARMVTLWCQTHPLRAAPDRPETPARTRSPTRGSVVFYARRYLGLRLSKALSCTNKRGSRGTSSRAACLPGLVGRRGDRGRGGVGRIPVFLVTLVLILGVRIFGEDPPGEVRVVQVPAESLDGLFVDHVLRSPG